MKVKCKKNQCLPKPLKSCTSGLDPLPQKSTVYIFFTHWTLDAVPKGRDIESGPCPDLLHTKTLLLTKHFHHLFFTSIYYLVENTSLTEVPLRTVLALWSSHFYTGTGQCWVFPIRRCYYTCGKPVVGCDRYKLRIDLK